MSKILMLLEHSLDIHDGRIERETKTLSDHGFEITIFTPSKERFPETEQRENYLIRRIINDAIQSPFKNKYKELVISIVKVITEEKFKVLHCHDFKMFVLGCDIKKQIPEIKVIYDSHEYLAGWPFYETMPGFWLKLKDRFMWNWYVWKEREYAKVYADAIMSVSQSIVDLMKIRFCRNDITLLRNIPLIPQKCSHKYFHEFFKISMDQKVVLHSGNIYHSDKRAMMMIKAFKETHNVKLVFMGLPYNNEKKYHAMVAELDASSEVFFHDPVHANEVTYYLSAADLGIVHTWKPQWKSYWYSLPNKIMELSVAGVPIICTSQPEFVRFGDEYKHAEYYEGNSLSQLKSALSKAVDNFDELKRNAIKIKGNLNWESESLNLTSLYEKL